LVYNSDADSIQVVNRTNGELVCDVFQFQGGTVVTNGDRLERLTFVFVPDQSDSVGSAVLRERATGTDVNDVNRARINGRIQFTMPELLSAGTSEDTSAIASADTNNVSGGDSSTNNASDGSTNTDNSSGDNSAVMPVQFVAASSDVAPTNSNVQVCTGTFSVGRRLSLAEESQNTGETTSTNAQTGEIQTGTAGTPGSTGTNSGTTTTIVTTNITTTVTNTTGSMLPLLGF
jgi:hypothetical protein